MRMGEATTARTIRRRLVPERWTNPEEIVNIPVWPWDRPGHRQAAAVRSMGERRELEATNPTSSKNFCCLPPLARVSGEPCSEPDQAADDRARRLHYPCVAINSTSKGFHCCFFCLRWDTPAIPSSMHCLCFPTPLFVIAELVPMLELGMAEPVQIHAVEAGIFWLAASRNRSVTSNVPGLPWVLEGSKVFCGSVARVRMPTSLLPKPPAEAGTVEKSAPETVGLRRARLDPGVSWVQSNARIHTSTRSLTDMPCKNGRTPSRNSEGPTTAGRG